MSAEEQDEPETVLLGLDATGLERYVEQCGSTLGERDVRRVLRHPFASAEVVEALVAHRSLISGYAVRARIARHPRTAVQTALRFVPGLFWRDLMEISIDMRVAPSVRRVAERYLLGRLPSLAVGERIALARRAAAPVLAVLRNDREPRVIDALLDNPRLTEANLVTLVADRRHHPRVLERVARHGRWRGRYAIRAGLCRNPQTPLQAQLTLLPGLRRDDLLAIIRDVTQSSVVQRRARELLEGRTPRRVPRGGAR